VPATPGARRAVGVGEARARHRAGRPAGRRHQGTDLLAPRGAPAYAVVSGRVRTASSSLGGISLYLDGDNGETYFYAHNSANVASNGQRVQAGDLVAKVGSTGNAGGTNHVHFERQVGGRSVNPYDFLRRIC
jgi:murein DD-endopeptidase MepM/ murein hydrolase activator NlpD